MSRPGPSLGEPERLVAALSEDPALARLGELARDVPRPPALADAALARVFQRLTRAPARRFGLGPRRLVIVLAVLALASVALGRYGLRRSRPVAPSTSAAPAPSPATASRTPAGPALPAAAPAPAPDLVAPTPVAAPLPPPAAASLPVSPESQLSAESKALEPALAALRRDRDAARALVLLERYQAAFPHGVLSLEARVVRIDALLALGRRPEALGLLDALPLERVGRRVELRLLRAELRASGDCRAALPDFDQVLSAAPAASVEERALRGRALCHASLGDTARARTDADRYLAKYPAGRFATELRALGSP